jgi:hypothetical protein
LLPLLASRDDETKGQTGGGSTVVISGIFLVGALMFVLRSFYEMRMHSEKAAMKPQMRRV